jgi:ABC-type phosphate transport system auxiliary subunit
MNPDEKGVSESSGRPIAFGYTPGGRYICVVYEEIDAFTLYPVTAFEVED